MRQKAMVGFAMAIVSAALALAPAAMATTQRLWTNAAFSELAPSELQNEFGANFSMYSTQFVINIPGETTWTCTSSSLGGTIKSNTTTATELELQSFTLGSCKDLSGNKLTLLNKTTTPWNLSWTAANSFELTGLSDQLTDGPSVCVISNSAGKKFNGTWTNATHSSLAFVEQPITIAACSLFEGTAYITATYAMEAASGPNNNLWLH
jgi:hypothetical protein